MSSQARYVGFVQHLVGVATQQWELQGEGMAFNKPWETHNQAAEEVARIELEISSHPGEVPSLVRRYYRTMAIAVRGRMAKKRTGCAAARKKVAARALKLGAGFRDAVKSQAYRAAALLLEAAGDERTTHRSVMSNNAYIGGRPVWDRIVKTAQEAASAAVDARAQPRELRGLFGLFLAQFMAAARTQRRADKMSWGVTKTRLTAQLLREGLPQDPVRAAAYTAAALMLASTSGGSPSEGTATCSEPSVGRSEARRVLAPAAAAPAVRVLPPTGVPRASWATRRYTRPGPTDAPAPSRTESANNTVAGVGGRVTGLQSQKASPMSTIAETAAEVVSAGGASGATARPTSSAPPRCTVASGNGTPENVSDKRKESLESGVAPGMAAEVMGTGAGSGATTGPGSTPFGAVQGVGALGSGSSGLDTVSRDTSTASGSAAAASTPPMCFSSAPMAAEAAAAAAAAVDYRRVSSVLLGDDALGPDNSEVCGVGPGVPVGSAAAVATAAAAAAVVTAAAAAAAAATSRPVVTGAGLQGAGATVAALPASLNNSEMTGAFMPPISSGREARGNNSGSDVDTGSGANGPTDDSGGGGGSMLGTKRKADSSSTSEGEGENQPCDGGATKKARAGSRDGGR